MVVGEQWSERHLGDDKKDNWNVVFTTYMGQEQKQIQMKVLDLLRDSFILIGENSEIKQKIDTAKQYFYLVFTQYDQ